MMQKCLVITGMHRSGTSALTGLLDILGINLGLSLMNPARENPKGFFENYKISQLHERILKSLDSSWDDVFFLPENWWNSEHLHPYRQEIIDIINIFIGGTYADLTFGEGGHSEALLRAGAKEVFGLDRDREAVDHDDPDHLSRQSPFCYVY